MRNYKLIGLTGTTGSGKGEVAAIFRERGFEVIDADVLARRAVRNPVVLRNLQSFFGEDILQDKELNRKLLAQRAFSSKENIMLLNSIVHPHITPFFLSEIRRITESGGGKLIFDAPQLFESGLDILCDYTIAVTAEVGLRINRIMVRDGITEEQAMDRINSQFSDRFFAEKCDYVIRNNSDFSELVRSADAVLEIIGRQE